MKDAYFGQKPFITLSNIGLQVELTPWIGKLQPVTQPLVTTLSLQVIKDHWQFFMSITFDKDKLEQWKHLRCIRTTKRIDLYAIRSFGSGHDLDFDLVLGQILPWLFKVKSSFIRRVLTRGTRCGQSESRAFAESRVITAKLFYLGFLLSRGQTVDLS